MKFKIIAVIEFALILVLAGFLLMRLISLKSLSLWKIPHTDITISQVKEDPRQGEYLFTPKTVAII